MTVFDLPAVDALVKAAVSEDLGAGDITTQLTVPATAPATAVIEAKCEAVIAGMPLIRKMCAAIGGGI